METIKEYILRYIKTNGHMPASVQGDDFDFVLTGAIDSIAMFKFMSDIERCYDIEISGSEADCPDLRTVSGLASFIQSKLDEKS